MAASDTATNAVSGPGSRVRRALRSRWLLWTGFGAVHLLLVLLNLYGQGWPVGDIEAVYRHWAVNAEQGLVRMGIDAPWVYPILAFAPMAASLAFGVESYTVTWLGLVTVLDGVAFSVLLGRAGASRTRFAAAWWWLAFLALLGPIALGRIDAVTVPFAMLGLLWALGRPRVAAVLLTIGAWIKVWPAGLVATLVVASRRRLEVVAIALSLTVGIVAASLVAGSGANVLGFVQQQAGRGLQIESPLAVPFLWRIVAGDGAVRVYYDRDILTYQVAAPGADVAAALTTPALAAGVAVVVLLGVRAVRRGAHTARVLPPLATAMVGVLILANKVGSPQFVTWLAAPVVLAIVVDRAHARAPAILAFGIAAATHVVYPYWYGWLLAADPAFVGVLTVKVLLLAGLVGWAAARLWRIGSERIGSERTRVRAIA